MVVRCPGCQTAYRLEVARLPPAGLRVRCPRCAHVFRLRAVAAPAPAPATPPLAEAVEGLQGFERDLREPPRSRPPTPKRGPEPSQPAQRPPLPARQAASERTLQLGPPEQKAPPPRLETPPFRPTAAPEPAVATAPAPERSLAGQEEPAPSALGAAADRARRLARVLVSDIMVYNQAARDQARAVGNLATTLGPEISKAWELYKSKVSPEVVASTTHFKDALNEILAEGEKIF